MITGGSAVVFVAALATALATGLGALPFAFGGAACAAGSARPTPSRRSHARRERSLVDRRRRAQQRAHRHRRHRRGGLRLPRLSRRRRPRWFTSVPCAAPMRQGAPDRRCDDGAFCGRGHRRRAPPSATPSVRALDRGRDRRSEHSEGLAISLVLVPRGTRVRRRPAGASSRASPSHCSHSLLSCSSSSSRRSCRSDSASRRERWCGWSAASSSRRRSKGPRRAVLVGVLVSFVLMLALQLVLAA